MTKVIFEVGNPMDVELTAFAADLLVPKTEGLIPAQGQLAAEAVKVAEDITQVSPVLVGRLALDGLATV